MKQIKKISLFILGLALVFTMSSKFLANAEEDGYREAGEAETSNVYGSMEVNTQRIETINNGTVTVRDRDTMEQITLKLEEVVDYVKERIQF